MAGNNIQQILAQLREEPSIKGCAVVTEDGIIVAGELGERFREDVVAGLTSFLVSSTRRSLGEGEMGDFHAFVLHATHGKLLLVAIDEAYLVAITDQFADLETAQERVWAAAEALFHASQVEG